MDVSYESVIGRPELNLDIQSTLSGTLKSERILITGAGGSIGSKLVASIARFPDLDMLATDRDENRLHSLSLEIMGTALFDYVATIIGAIILSKVTGIPLVLTTIGLFVLGIILHMAFCLRTGTEMWLFGK